MTDRKSNTIYCEVRGTAEWAKVFEQNRDKVGPDGAWESHGGMCVTDAILDEENLQILIDAGSQSANNVKNNPKKHTEDGRYRLQLKRKWEAPYTYGGAPQVRHADGQTPWDIEEDGLIGNGSECVFYVSVYEVRGRKGTRLDGVQVIDHVEYVSDGDYTPGPRMNNYASTPKEETKAEAPKETKSAKKASKPIAEDVIPFDEGGAP